MGQRQPRLDSEPTCYSKPEPYLRQWAKTPIDFTYEREWRLPASMDFELTDIAFVFVPTHTHIAAMPPRAVAALGVDKWITVSSYHKIEELWPQHNIGHIA